MSKMHRRKQISHKSGPPPAVRLRGKDRRVSHEKMQKSSRKARVRKLALKLSTDEAERILKDKNFAHQKGVQDSMPVEEVEAAARKALRWQSLS